MGRSSSIFIIFAFSAVASTASVASASSWSASPRDDGRGIASPAIVAQGYGEGFGPGGGFGPPEPGADLGSIGPPPPFALAPPPCIQPMIIEVGRGLAHKVQTRIVYGSRPPCG